MVLIYERDYDALQKEVEDPTYTKEQLKNVVLHLIKENQKLCNLYSKSLRSVNNHEKVVVLLESILVYVKKLTEEEGNLMEAIYRYLDNGTECARDAIICFNKVKQLLDQLKFEATYESEPDWNTATSSTVQLTSRIAQLNTPATPLPSTSSQNYGKRKRYLSSSQDKFPRNNKKSKLSNALTDEQGSTVLNGRKKRVTYRSRSRRLSYDEYHSNSPLAQGEIDKGSFSTSRKTRRALNRNNEHYINYLINLYKIPKSEVVLIDVLHNPPSSDDPNVNKLIQKFSDTFIQREQKGSVSESDDITSNKDVHTLPDNSLVSERQDAKGQPSDSDEFVSSNNDREDQNDDGGDNCLEEELENVEEEEEEEEEEGGNLEEEEEDKDDDDDMVDEEEEEEEEEEEDDDDEKGEDSVNEDENEMEEEEKETEEDCEQSGEKEEEDCNENSDDEKEFNCDQNFEKEEDCEGSFSDEENDNDDSIAEEDVSHIIEKKKELKRNSIANNVNSLADDKGPRSPNINGVTSNDEEIDTSHMNNAERRFPTSTFKRIGMGPRTPPGSPIESDTEESWFIYAAD